MSNQRAIGVNSAFRPCGSSKADACHPVHGRHNRLAKRHRQFKHQMTKQVAELVRRVKLPIRPVVLVGRHDDDAMYVKSYGDTYGEFFTLGMYHDGELVATVQLTKNFTDTYQLNAMTRPDHRRQGRQRLLVAVSMLPLRQLDNDAVLDVLFTCPEFMAAFGEYKTQQPTHNRLIIYTSDNQHTAAQTVRSWITLHQPDQPDQTGTDHNQ